MTSYCRPPLVKQSLLSALEKSKEIFCNIYSNRVTTWSYVEFDLAELSFIWPNLG